jgi:hypothetical protein
MHRWLLPVATAAVMMLATTTAEAGRRDPKAPNAGGVKVTTSGNQVKYTVRRAGRPASPGRARVNPGSVACRSWSTFETVTVDGKQTVVEHRWRQCFSTVTGNPTGPAREVIPGAGGSAPSEEVWTAVVPDPVLQRQNGVRFVTQRTAWVWLPPEYFRGIRVDLRSSTGQVRFGAATARATQAVIHPGFGGPSNGLDCTAEAQFPYDIARDFWDQLSCPLWFMKSSVDEPGGVYTATATVAWEVNAVVDGEVAETATVVTDSTATVRVEELQALVTCVGGSAGSCPAGIKTRK